MKTMFVVPAVVGELVPGPDRTILPSTGDFVPRNKWWLRRLLQGDVVVGVPPQTESSDNAEDGES